LIDRFNPPRRKVVSPGAITSCIQVEQLPDLLEREARRLRLSDEPKAPQIVFRITADAAVARWRGKKASSLVEADRLNANAARFRQASNREGLTLYHGTHLT
jgi:hypothetical protein